ncbi:thermonuclease family protein [soil metagenome]
MSRPPVRGASSWGGAPRWMFSLVFAVGVAAGTLIPVRDYLPSHLPSTKASAALAPPSAQSNQARSHVSTTWSRDGQPGIRHAAEVLRVIDGDTFEARVRLWPGLEMTTRVRLRGIDAPEMKSGCADELRMAQAATEALGALLTDGDVAIFDIGPDKYNGRVVADAATRRTPSVSSALLAAGHARPYQGGKRSGWCTAAMR